MEEERHIKYIEAICESTLMKIKKGKDPIEEFQADIQNYILIFPEIIKEDKRKEDDLPF